MTETAGRHVNEGAELRGRLEEAEQTLRAITRGEVDALVVESENGPQVYTLKSAAEPYRMLVEQMREGALTLSKQGVILYCNEAFARLVGGATTRLTSSPVLAFIAERDFERLAAPGGCSSLETTIRHKSGAEIPVLVSSVLLRPDTEELISVIITDITERKRAEEQVRLLMHEVNHRAKNVLSLVLAIARQTAASGHENFLDRFGERIQALAASHDLLVKSQWKNIGLRDLVNSQLAHFADLLGARIIVTGPQLQISVRAAQAIGMAVHELATNAGKYGALSVKNGCVEITWDIEQSSGEEADFVMTWSERGGPAAKAPSRRGFGSYVIRDMIEASLHAATSLDFGGCGLTWQVRCPANSVADGYEVSRPNGNACLTPETFAARPSKKPRVLVVEDEPIAKPLRPEILAAEVWQCAGGGRSDNGTTGRKEAGDAMRRPNAELEARVRERAAELGHAQNMESLGRLTGGIAHDFNNLLGVVLANLELLKRHVSGKPQEERFLRNAAEGAKRGAGLVQRMLAYARRQELNPVPVDIAGLVDGLLPVLSSTLGPGTQITTKFAKGLWLALADANQLELAIHNLAVNAHDAMPAGGTLKLLARNEIVTSPRRGLVPGDYVRLTVADSGFGMDKPTLRYATEPFFTTKERGKGKGLGLSTVEGVANQLGGSLRLISRPGRGTIVHLWLPRSPGEATEQCGSPRNSGKPEAGLRKLLLVEDDALMLTATSDMLKDAGYEVVCAQSAQGALELLRTGTAPDAVLTDYGMPGMNGLELAQEIRRISPGIPVILITGYAEIPSGFALPRLNKPFGQQALIKVIRACGPTLN